MDVVTKVTELPAEDFPGKENVEKVLAAARAKSVDLTMLYHPSFAVSSLESHLQIHEGDESTVLKCLAFVGKQGPFVVIASGEVRLDNAKLRETTGYSGISMAKPPEMQEHFGRGPGGLDFLTIPPAVPVWIEKKLLEKEWVIGSCGSPHMGLKVSPQEILRATGYPVADLSRAEAPGGPAAG